MEMNKKTIPCKEWINKQVNKQKVQIMTQFAQVMSDPNKIKIMLLLDQYNRHNDETYQDMYVSDLAEHLEMSLSAISHSLRHLENQGFVKKEKFGRTVKYSLTELGLSFISYSEVLTV